MNSFEKLLLQAQQHWLEFKQSESKSGEAAYKTGLTLIESKKAIPHGEFQRFLHEVGIGERLAQMFMSLARAEDGRELASLGIAKATRLLSIKLEQRKELMKNQDLQKFTVEELKRLVQSNCPGKVNNKNSSWKSGYRRGYFDKSIPSETLMAWAAGVLHLNIDEITLDLVNSAYKQMAIIFHTDKGNCQNHSHMQLINYAREILCKRIRGKAA